MKLLPEYALVAPARPRIVLPKKSRKAPLVSLVRQPSVFVGGGGGG